MFIVSVRVGHSPVGLGLDIAVGVLKCPHPKKTFSNVLPMKHQFSKEPYMIL